MKTLHLVLLGAVAFLAACGVNPNPTPAQPQTNPDQTNRTLSPLGVSWQVAALNSGVDLGSEISVVLDANSRPVISFSSNNRLMLMHCGDTTCTTNNSIKDVDIGGKYNSLVLDAGGRPVITYLSHLNDYSSSYPNGYDVLNLVHCGNTNCSSGNIYRLLDSGFPAPYHSSLVLDTAGNPVISYMSGGANMMLSHCGDINCSTMSWNSLDLFVGDISMALDASGDPVIGYPGRPYPQNSNYDLKLVHCSNTNCNNPTVRRTLESSPITTEHPSLILDSIGRPVMSYYDATNKDLRVVHCGDTICGSGNHYQIVDSTGDVGWNPSMKLDAAGKPIIAYLDRTNPNNFIKLAQCGDTNCSSGNVRQAVASIGMNTLFFSLALDSGSNAVIAFGSGTGQLWLARQIPNNITPPTITPTLTGTMGSNGWYVSDLTLSWSLADHGSPITTSNGCQTLTLNTDGERASTCTASNGGGTTSKSIAYKRDATKPSFNLSVNPNPVLQYLSVTATPNAADSVSGVASQGCPTPITSTVGNVSMTCTATDRAGNQAKVTTGYTVISASQGIAILMNQVNVSFGITGFVRGQLLNILAGAQANLAVSKPTTLSLLNYFISVVNSQPPFPYGIDPGTGAVLIRSAQTLIASVIAGP